MFCAWTDDGCRAKTTKKHQFTCRVELRLSAADRYCLFSAVSALLPEGRVAGIGLVGLRTETLHAIRYCAGEFDLRTPPALNDPYLVDRNQVLLGAVWGVVE